jgi:hypothetical protein
MFIENKYNTWYKKLIENAVVRNWKRKKGRERHHILPKSIGGTDEKSNLVYITAREHFICHWLLIKMTDGDYRSKMIYALRGMKAENKNQERYHTRITSRVYERYRLEHSKIHSKRMKGVTPWNKGGVEITDQHRENLVKAALNRPAKTEEAIQKWKESRVGYRHSEETRLKQSLASKGKPKGPQSEEHRAAISAGGKGIKKKEGHADNVRKSNLGNVSINKDGIEKKVKRDTLDTWLAEGWQLGGRKRL